MAGSSPGVLSCAECAPVADQHLVGWVGGIVLDDSLLSFFCLTQLAAGGTAALVKVWQENNQPRNKCRGGMSGVFLLCVSIQKCLFPDPEIDNITVPPP